jgi:flagellar biogenesis protein FliO
LDLLPQFAAVLVVFAVLGLTLWWLRKRGALQLNSKLPFRFPMKPSGRRGKILEHLDTLPLSSTHSLNVVKMADRVILVGTSPSGFYLVESSSWKSLQSQMQEGHAEEVRP